MRDAEQQGRREARHDRDVQHREHEDDRHCWIELDRRRFAGDAIEHPDWQLAAHERDGPCAEPHAEHAAGAPERECFDHDLPDQSHARRAERAPDVELLAAADHLRHQQGGDIHGGEQQGGQGRDEQQHEPRTHVTEVKGAKVLRPRCRHGIGRAVLREHSRGDALDLRGAMFDRAAVRHAADHVLDDAGCPVGHLLGADSEWHEDIEPLREQPEMARHHAYHEVGAIGVVHVLGPGQIDDRPHDLRIRAESPRPEAVCQDDGSFAPGGVARLKRAAVHRRHASHVEEIRRDHCGDERLRFTAVDNAEVGVCVRRKRGVTDAGFPLVPDRRRQEPVRARRIGRLDVHQPRRVGERKRPPQDRVDDGEDRRASGHSHRHRDQQTNGRRRCPTGDPSSQSNVPPQIRHSRFPCWRTLAPVS